MALNLLIGRMILDFLSQKKLLFVLRLTGLYIIVLGFRSFLFSHNDVVDVMSYAKYLNDTGLFPRDFYIQNISGAIPNERLVFSSFLAIFGNQLVWLTLILHWLSSMILFSGIYAISSKFIEYDLLRWLLILTLFIPLYGIGPGDCELFYNMFISSLLAKSLGIWALYYYLERKFNISVLLLIPATFIHPTVGAQLFLCITLIIIIWSLIKKEWRSWPSVLLYLLSAGVWLLLLYFRVDEAGQYSNELFFEIFEFRLAHHFFPGYFKSIDVIAGFVLLITGLYYFLKKGHVFSASFIIVLFSGMLIYTLSHYFLQLGIILSSQWFKTFIWVELLGLIALFAMINALFIKLRLPKLFFRIGTNILWTFSVVMLIMIHWPGNYFSNKQPDLFYMQHFDPEVDIAQKAKQLTTQDDLFIVPMEFTAFKYHSERSLFIDYKSVVHRKEVLGEWYGRIKKIYRIDIKNRQNGDNLYLKGRDNYLAIDAAYCLDLKDLGIDYMVTYSDHKLPYSIIAENNRFRIYDLKKH